MTPKENLTLKKLNNRSTVLMSIILIVLVAYFPLINYNTKKATQAYDKAEFVESIISTKLDAVLDKLDIYVLQHNKEIESMKETIENGRLNHAEIATKLLEKGILKANDITIRSNI